MSYRSKHISPKLKKLKPKKRFWQSRIFWFMALVLLGGGVFTYFFLFFPKTQIRRIEVSGNQKILTPEIEAIGWKYSNRALLPFNILNLSSKSIFTANTSAISHDVLSTYTAIKEVSAKRIFPNGIAITVKERTPVAVFCQTECFFIDKDGVLFESLGSSNTSTLPTIIDSQDVKTAKGGMAVPTSTMKVIAEVGQNLEQRFGVRVVKVLIGQTLVFVTQEGWNIYLDATEGIDMQIQKMNILLEQQIPAERRKTLKYIYLQYKDRAYYK